MYKAWVKLVMVCIPMVDLLYIFGPGAFSPLYGVYSIIEGGKELEEIFNSLRPPGS